jgi:hypothetical protein
VAPFWSPGDISQTREVFPPPHTRREANSRRRGDLTDNETTMCERRKGPREGGGRSYWRSDIAVPLAHQFVSPRPNHRPGFASILVFIFFPLGAYRRRICDGKHRAFFNITSDNITAARFSTLSRPSVHAPRPGPASGTGRGRLGEFCERERRDRATGNPLHSRPQQSALLRWEETGHYQGRPLDLAVPYI